MEALDEADLKRAVAQIHEAGLLAAAALKPKTPASALSPVIAELDMALVMSVEPGFSGQSYIAGSDLKVAEVVQMARAAGNEELLIQVDGGIGLSTAPLVAADAVCLSCGAHPAKPNVASTPAAAAPVMNERRDTPVSLIPITASSNDGFTCSMRHRGASRETTLRTQTGARTPPEAGNCETPLEVGCSTWGYGRGIVKANFRMSLL